MADSTAWHGFQRLLDYLKASIAVGAPIAAALWAMLTYALDDRYAPFEIQSNVRQNGIVASEVAQKIQQVNVQLAEIRIQSIRDSIFETKLRACNASSSEARQFFSQRIAGLNQEYTKVTGSAPFIPTCEDLQ